MSELAVTTGINESNTYWEAAARGELLLKRCIDTGKAFFYPREHSPFTGGRTEWFKASGRGVIYSCSVNYRGKPPYCIAYILLDEGPIMMSGVEHEPIDQVAIGQRVKVVFRADANGRPTPFFVLGD